ncbi:MAG: hypothetical protein JWR85_1798 [Marmoricola sp.]|nr:hypothetical protein [Marmoricola sp.]
MKRRLFSSTVLAVVAAFALTACGSGDSAGDGGGDFNDSDVTFAQSMIPHHEQAVEMARMAKMHASTPEVKNLADKIESAQGPEIATMKGWLKDWGKDESSGDSMEGMDHSSEDSGMDMPGMMSKDDMSGLEKATGTQFDQMFLTMMIAHHTGAIEMAKTEQSKGRNADAKALAKQIDAAQTTEIADMKEMQTP